MLEVLKNINLNKIFTTTHKTINIVNKAIPVYKQIKPNIGNIKSIFNKKSIVNDIDEIKESRPIKLKRNIPNNARNTSNNSLTFFQ